MSNKLLTDNVLDRIRKNIKSTGNRKNPAHNAKNYASGYARLKIDPKTELPPDLSKWPPVARYMVKELERLANLPLDRAELVVRVAWFNATVCGDDLERGEA